MSLTLTIVGAPENSSYRKKEGLNCAESMPSLMLSLFPSSHQKSKILELKTSPANLSFPQLKRPHLPGYPKSRMMFVPSKLYKTQSLPTSLGRSALVTPKLSNNKESRSLRMKSATEPAVITEAMLK